MTRASPTWARMRSTWSAMTLPLFQSAAMPAPSRRKFSITRWPNSVCLTSGCHCRPKIRRSRFSKAATGVESLDASTANPSGAFATESPWLIQVGLVGRLVGEQRAAVGDVHRRRAVLPLAGLGDLAAELLRDHLEAVADAEHRHPELEDGRVEAGRARLVDAGRAAAEHDADRVLRGDLGRRHGVRHDLAVHVRLADPAGDQLRVLRAEVDDEHRPWLSHGRPRSHPARTAARSAPGRTRAAARCRRAR